ncbi:hypothetical protein Cus16_0958 [Curtobacterium sp. ER1/6]|nr:hypothetical protein Cus16_0958 [Curtobacterium sp. ER1/6]
MDPGAPGCRPPDGRRCCRRHRRRRGVRRHRARERHQGRARLRSTDHPGSLVGCCSRSAGGPLMPVAGVRER